MISIFPLLPVFGSTFVRWIHWSMRSFATEIITNEDFRDIFLGKIKCFLVDHFDLDDSKVLGIPELSSEQITNLTSDVFKNQIMETLFVKMLPDVLPELDNDKGVSLNSFDDLVDEDSMLTTTGNNLLMTKVLDSIINDSSNTEEDFSRFTDYDVMKKFFSKINLNFHVIDNVIKVSAYDPSYIEGFEDAVNLNINRKVYPVGILVGICFLQRQDDDTFDNEIHYGYTEANNFSSYNFINEEFKIAPRLSARLNSKYRSSLHNKYNGKIDSKKQNWGYIINKNGTAVLPTTYDIASLEGFVLQIMKSIFSLGSYTISGENSITSKLFSKGHPDGVLYRDKIVSSFEGARPLDATLNGHSTIAKNHYKMGIMSSILPIIQTWRSIIISSSNSNKYDRRNLYLLSGKFSYEDDSWLSDIYKSKNQFDILKNYYDETVGSADTDFIQQIQEEIIEFIKDEDGVHKNWIDNWFGCSDSKKKNVNESLTTKDLLSNNSSNDLDIRNNIFEKLRGT